MTKPGGENVAVGAEIPKLQFEDSIFPMYVIVSKTEVYDLQFCHLGNEDITDSLWDI